MDEREIALKAAVKSLLRAKSWQPSSGQLSSPLGNRLAELEVENLRLQGLVAELLIKNQQLRLELKEVRGTSG
jgi:hypothetical protein